MRTPGRAAHITASLDAQTPGVRTTRFCRTRTAPVVCALLNRSRAKPALRLLARRCAPRPPPPGPRIVTIAKRPLSLGQDEEHIRYFRISVKQNFWIAARDPEVTHSNAATWAPALQRTAEVALRCVRGTRERERERERHALSRHCERLVRRSSKSEGGSEAIQECIRGSSLDCFVARAPRNDEEERLRVWRRSTSPRQFLYPVATDLMQRTV
ncbi:hypothetical protein ABIF94_004095 [Bradyrhizobium ottawaense]